MEVYDMVQTTNDPTLNTWHRWFRRTNVHIAEYILMLVMMGSMLGLVASLWYSFFGLMYETGPEARTLAMAAAGQLAALLVVGPAAFWLYARTSGQEMVQPELSTRRSHTVFLAIWMIGVVLTLVGVAVSMKAAAFMSIFGFGDGDVGKMAMTVLLPGLFVLATLGFGLCAVVKHANRKLSMLTGVILGATLALLVVANVVMVVVKKDAGSTSEPTCTFSRYLDKECSYSEYLDQQDRSSYDYNSRSVTGGFENLFMPSSR